MAGVRKDLATAKSNMPTKIKEVVKEVVSDQVVIASIEAQAKIPFAKLTKFTKIKDQDEMALASTQVKILKELSKEATRQENGITASMYESIAKVEALFKPFKDKVKAADLDTKTKILEYQQELETARLKLEEDFKSGKVKKVSTYTEKSSALVGGSSGAAKITNKTKLSITDPKKIPREYLIVDERMVEEALKAGKKVPGAELIKIKGVSI